MRIVVATGSCQGHNICQAYAADMLSINEHGFAEVCNDGDLMEAQLIRARLAEVNCPEQAISLWED